MNAHLYLDYDIETASNDDVDNYLEDLDFKPRGNLKDPKKIEQDLVDKKAKQKAFAPLYWWMNRPVTIVVYDEYIDKYFSFTDPNPQKLLAQFCNLLITEYPNHILCGKNSNTFDNPVVTGWLIKWNMGVPEHFKRHLRGLPLTDIDQIFGLGSLANQRTTLENYAYGMGIDGKSLHGGQVADYYRAAQLGDETAMDTIVQYCKQDVKIQSEMRKRFLKNYTLINI